MRQDNRQLRWQPPSLATSLLLALLCLILGSSNAEIANEELCACTPRVYEFTFDFSLECEPLNVDLESGGIIDASCLVSGFDDLNVTDLVPVAVSSVQIIEIGQDGTPIAIAQEKGDFRDGGTFTYNSVSFEGAVAPRAFQVRAIGRNEAGEPLVLQWAVTYSNNCGVFPVLQLDDSIGWTIFTGLAEPLELVCPLIVTPAPSFPEVEFDPTEEPGTDPPTFPPTEAPSFPPSPEPTKAPAGPPPSPPPTEPPTKPPTVPTRRSFIEEAVSHDMVEQSSFDAEQDVSPENSSFDPPPSVDDKDVTEPELSSLDGLHAYEMHEGTGHFSGDAAKAASVDETTDPPITSIDHDEAESVDETTDPPDTSIGHGEAEGEKAASVDETTEASVASIDHDEASHDQSGHSSESQDKEDENWFGFESKDHDEASHDQSGHSSESKDEEDENWFGFKSKDHDEASHDQSGHSSESQDEEDENWIGFESKEEAPVEESHHEQTKPIEEGTRKRKHKAKPRSKTRAKSKSKSVETKGRRRRLRRGRNHREKGL